MAKRFFYVCAGLLCLVIAYQLGATRASAQGSPAIGIRQIAVYGDRAWVVTEQNDIFTVDAKSAKPVAQGDGWAKYQLGIFH